MVIRQAGLSDIGGGGSEGVRGCPTCKGDETQKGQIVRSFYSKNQNIAINSEVNRELIELKKGYLVFLM